MKKIVLFEGGIETLSYFSKQLEKSFIELGYEVFMFDLDNETESIKKLVWFYEQGEMLMIGFNFNGIRGEEAFFDSEGNRFWEELDIPVINIVVDHPYYYHNLIQTAPKNYYQICIDRNHFRYMERFFNHIKLGQFMPLAGTQIHSKNIPIKDRKYDVVFVGNYTKPESFDKQIYRIDEEYAAFYLSIIDRLLKNPELTTEEVYEKRCIEEMGKLSEEDLAKCMESMIFIDLYIRFAMRENALVSLADAGIKIDVFGAGYEEIKLKCNNPENIVIHGPLDSKGCLEALAEAKISLNVMPWFKDGAHDRIFNAMMNGSVSVTDDSIYLKENFRDGRTICFYSLKEVEKLPDIVEGLLADEDRMQEIADAGYQEAKAEHTWKSRARLIEEDIINAL